MVFTPSNESDGVFTIRDSKALLALVGGIMLHFIVGAIAVVVFVASSHSYVL